MAISFNVYDSSWAAVSGQYFDETSNVKYKNNGSNGDLTGYTSLFGNAANTTQSAHISPTATDSYSNNGLVEFWSGTTYTTVFTKEIEKTSSNQTIPWEVRFVPSEDGYNKQSLDNSKWIISGTVISEALETNEQKVSVVVNGNLVTGVPYVYLNGTYVKGKAYVKTSSGYKPAKNP